MNAELTALHALFLPVLLGAQNARLDLGLEFFAHCGCGFHLVHFFDVDFSELVLHSNQHGQPWIVFDTSVSRPPALARPPPNTHLVLDLHRQVINVSLNLRESPLCNVHLLVQPEYTLFGTGAGATFEDYANLLSVLSERTRFIFVIDDGDGGQKSLDSLANHPPWTRRYGFAFFLMQIRRAGQDDIGAVVQRLEFCASLEVWLPLPTPSGCRASLSGRQLVVMHPTLVADTFACLSPHARLRHLEFGKCLAPLKAALFIGTQLNGSIEHSKTAVGGRWASIYLVQGYNPVLNEPRVATFVLDWAPVSLAYCEYDRRRIRNEFNWVGIFDDCTWLLLLTAAGLGLLVHGIHGVRDAAGHGLRSDLLFGFIRLLQREVRARTKFQLGIAVTAAIFLGCYENYMTSMTVIPNSPLLYDTVAELMAAGHKIQFCDPVLDVSCKRSDPPSVTFAADFARLGVDQPSIVSITQAEFMQAQMRRGHVKLVHSDWNQIIECWYQYHAPPGALCHVLRQSLGVNHRSGVFLGLLQDAMVGVMQSLLESGIFPWWRALEGYELKLESESERRRLGYQEQELQDSSAPRPVAMDFEVIRIFPICGCLLGVATLVFFLEVMHCRWRENCWLPCGRLEE